MKAPDKVYVRIADDDDIGTASVSERPFSKAFIRKEALLEWLENQKKCFMQDADYGVGYVDALEEIFDKINEM